MGSAIQTIIAYRLLCVMDTCVKWYCVVYYEVDESEEWTLNSIPMPYQNVVEKWKAMLHSSSLSSRI